MTRNRLLADAYAGFFTTVNLSPIDVGYGLVMLALLGLQHADQGIGAAFLAIVVANLITALLGGVGLLFSGARPAQTILIAELVLALHQQQATPTLEALLFHVACCVVLAGLFQSLLGLVRAGNLVKYLPVPVLTGYINAVALMICGAGLAMTLGAKSLLLALESVLVAAHGNLVLLALAVLGVMGMVHLHCRRLHWSIAGLFGGTLLALIMEQGAGIPVGDKLPDIGILLPEWQGALAAWKGSIALAPGTIFRTVFPYALAIAVLNAIESLLAAAKYDELADTRSNANRVLLVQGCANMVGGLLGALPAAPSISRISLAHQLGATTRAALGFSALFALLMMVFGAQFLHLVPLSVVGMLMCFLGWTMVDAWTWRQVRKGLSLKSLEPSLRRQVKSNLFVMGVVIVVALSGHLISGMLIGALLAMFLYIRDHGRSIIGKSYSGNHRHSVVMRPEHEGHFLEQHGQCIEVIELGAPIVFGTADRLYNRMQNLRHGVQHLVLDFHRVRSIDDKGARILCRLVSGLQGGGTEVHFSGIQPDDMRGEVIKEAGGIRVLAVDQWHVDTDAALEIIENRLISGAGFAAHHTMNLRDLDISAGMTESDLAVLHRHLQADCYGGGQAIFRKGDAGHCIYILAIGRIDIYLSLDPSGNRQRRIAAIAPGVVFGEMAMLTDTPRSATAVAVEDSAVWIMTHEQLERLHLSHPALCARFLQNIARQLSARLAVTNDELGYAIR